MNELLHRCTAIALAGVVFLAALGVPSHATARIPATGIRSVHAAVAAVHAPPPRIAVPEPSPHARPPLPALASLHAAVSHDVHVPHGVRVAGPPMMRPGEIDGVLTAARQRAAQSRLHPHSAVPPAMRSVSPGGMRGGTAPGSSRGRGTRSVQFTAGTGINPWWRYQEENVPGGGRLMVNVGTGNLLLQDDDMIVPHKGIAMAFRRTYNAQSGHDTSGSDGSVPGMYGNGWTNTFDAHLSASGPGTITVWDTDGAHYEYTLASDNVTWVPPAGQHATLTSDGGFGLLWTKKSGSTYYFWMPANSAVSGSAWEAQYGAYEGRLYQIIGRNRNTFISFWYGFDNGNAAPGGKVSGIWAQAESGLTTSMFFADVAGHRLLQQIVFPDGVTSVQYGYDAAGNLTWVSRPPNNTAGTRPVAGYGYAASGGLLNWVASPRWNGPDGGALLWLSYNGTTAPTATVSGISHFGVVNPSINDGTGGALQPGAATGAVDYNDSWYGTGGSSAWFHDTDGHSTNWTLDSGRPVQTQQCTAMVGWSCTGTWLVSNETWDVNNNLVSEVDPRGNETDYLHDVMGNTIVVGEPYTTTSQGAFKPTKLYDYDAFNNVVAYCDESQSHAAHLDWVGTPASQSDSLCTTYAGTVPHWTATFARPSAEPYGELTSMTTPLGYTRTFSYAAAQQAGIDYGLPTAVTGSSFGQFDGSTITPAQTFWYDANGYLRCYSKGRGISVLSYDALGRTTSVADPDDSSANASSLCGKSTGQPGWNTQTTYTYYPDGTKHTAQTPSERAFGVAAAYSYDLDGNVTTETAHHGCVTNQLCPDGTTQKWYDGADRLVEVALPMDTRVYGDGTGMHYDAGKWVTRYWYDLSAGGTVSVAGSAPFRAYGNLYKTLVGFGSSWLDKSGSQFDALDREVAKFSWDVASPYSNTLETTQLSYDGGTTTLGLLRQKTNPRGEAVNYGYDEHARVLTETYSGDAGRTANETYAYDANGRAASVTSSQFGAQLNTYDADGRLTRVTEPTGGGVTDAAQIGYSYYPDGQRSAVSVTSPTFNQSNAIQYSYRADGLLQTQSLNAFATASWLKTYTDAGRVTGVGGVDSQQRTYDAAGQLQRQTIRGANIDYTHDPEGSPLTQYVPTPTTTGGDQNQLLTNTYNARGELADSIYTPNSARQFSHHRSTSSGGCIARDNIPLDGSYAPGANPAPAVMDSRSCATVFSGSMDSVNYNGTVYPVGSTNAFSFDTAGRLTRSVSVSSFLNDGGTYGVPPDQTTDPDFGNHAQNVPGTALTSVVTADTTYDALDHTLSRHPVRVRTRTNADNGGSTTTTWDQGTTMLAWGPNGHPLVVANSANATAPYMTLHWDGDIILFITDSTGNVIDFKAGLDGEIAPRDPYQSALVTYERDIAGVIIGSSVNGTTTIAPLDAWDGTGRNFGGLSSYAQYVRPDGFEIAGIQIDGVRAFDPAIGSWTTPDAFEGDIRDPASQQKYMWNRGNPVDYSDPSGFSSLDIYQFCGHNCDQLAVKGTVAMYNAVIGDDIKTLRGNASAGAKAFAAGMILMDFTGWPGIERLGGKAIFSITLKGVNHIAERHLIGGKFAAQKSLFNGGTTLNDVVAMIKTAVSKGQHSMEGLDTVFTYDFGRAIGWDKATSQETSKLRVIFDGDHNIRSAYPSEY